MQSQHAPAAVARFDQALELALGIAPIEQLVDECSINLAPAILSHPHFFELAQTQKQTHPLDVCFITLGRVGVDQPIVARLANEQSLHQRSHNRTGPTAHRPRFHGQIDWSVLSSQPLHMPLKHLPGRCKTRTPLRFTLMIQLPSTL